MSALLRWEFAFCLFFIIQGAASDSPPDSLVIYGADNRVDYYQESDPLVRAAADATASLVRASDVKANGATSTLNLVNFGGFYNLCPSERFYNQSVVGFCTGFLVDSQTVVTAGHCIYDQTTCDNTRLIFGFKVTDSVSLPTSVSTDHVFSCKSVVYSLMVLTGADFSVVKLDRPVNFVAPLAYRQSGTPAVGDPLRIIGYPAGLPVKISEGANVRSLQSTFLVGNLDDYGGNSGSPVFNRNSGEVEGVLVRGETDFVTSNNANGCRISNFCPDTGCRGEDVTLFSQILPYLN